MHYKSQSIPILPLQRANAKDHHDHSAGHAREEYGVEQLNLFGRRWHQIRIHLGTNAGAEAGAAQLAHATDARLQWLQFQALVCRRCRCTSAECKHRGGYEIAPDLGHLVEDEEQAKELNRVYILARVAAAHLRQRLGDGGQICALGAPQRTTAKAYHQGGRDERFEARIELGGYIRHVGEQGQGHGQPAAKPTVD